MRILQLIDTLNPGGAERMVVNYANCLSKFGHEAFAITTRQEGDFRMLLNPEVSYKFINKRRTFDMRAISRINKYIKKNKIDIIHAHGTSWFFGVICKLCGCKAKLIWHNHYGNSANMPFFKMKLLELFSNYFDGIISVNEDLKIWADKHLKCSKSIRLFNFVIFSEESNIVKDSKSVVCLANLKPVKNHELLLKACDLLKEFDIRLHIIGKDLKDEYSAKIIEEFNKRSYVKFHGQIIDPTSVLQKMQIGVLSSKSEGLPLALLEYGVAELAVIATDVGACKELLNEHGKLVDSGDIKNMANSIKEYLINKEKSKIDSSNFRKKVYSQYSANNIIPVYLNFCFSL